MDRNEGNVNDPPDDDERSLGVGGAWGVPNPASVRISSMTCSLSLSSSGNRPITFEEPGIWLAGSAIRTRGTVENRLGVFSLLQLRQTRKRGY